MNKMGSFVQAVGKGSHYAKSVSQLNIIYDKAKLDHKKWCQIMRLRVSGKLQETTSDSKPFPSIAFGKGSSYIVYCCIGAYVLYRVRTILC